MACTPKPVRRLKKKLFITPAERRAERKARARGEILHPYAVYRIHNIIRAISF